MRARCNDSAFKGPGRLDLVLHFKEPNADLLPATDAAAPVKGIRSQKSRKRAASRFPASRFPTPDSRTDLPGIRRKKLHVAGKPERAAGAIPSLASGIARPSSSGSVHRKAPYFTGPIKRPLDWIGFYTLIRPFRRPVTVIQA